MSAADGHATDRVDIAIATLNAKAELVLEQLVQTVREMSELMKRGADEDA